MRRAPWTITAVAMLAGARPAHAQPVAPVVAPAWRWSVGAGIAAFEHADTRWGLAPELLGHVRRAVSGRWSMSGGVRAWLRGLTQPEMPSGLALTERDLGGGGEISVRHDGHVAPMLMLGGAVTRRSLRARAAPEVDVRQSMLDHAEWLPGIYGQLGVGLPVSGGRVVLTPYVRYDWLPDDSRVRARWGLDVSIAIGGAGR